ncbi:DUF1203 domain-containing protein [Jannaschia aquimarina]|uniref:DUF1203 domain-containing protein n=2 Tax=Jannaschia aquimarina TaxID=935700 RepID=A0A0D1D2Z4_9RHOB|nr:DUF1203 domain-containing protein [Jannaschia aquimarina]KIT14478.1 hypothetical protein jaqu_37680 [Jannaschia aquimarina]SNT28809.1 Protein of unknown function [Jannaschia aquimarina]
MTFQIHALSPAPFADLFGLSDAELAARNARRVVVDAKPGAPCRVSLRDAELGETVLLANHVHLDAASPYRASHAVYVRAGVEQADPAPGEVPAMIARRDLSLRALDGDGMIVDAALMPGSKTAETLGRMLAAPHVVEVHLHFAARGCYAARATRA